MPQDIDIIYDCFSKLPPDSTGDYEKQIQRLGQKLKTENGISALTWIMDNDSQYGFEAFFCLATIHRRWKDFELMKKLIDTHPEFMNKKNYNHILIQYLVHSESFYDYEELLEMAYRDSIIFSQIAGYQQAFCNAFATICETCNDEDVDPIVNKWYEKALYCIDRAINIDPFYAKFYCTKGRILALKEMYFEGLNYIDQAISKEDSSRPDYFLTLLNYQPESVKLISSQI